MRAILPQYLASHKAKVRKIAHELNKDWSSKSKSWFDVTEIRFAYSDLWGDYKFSFQKYSILSEFHCMQWKYIDSTSRQSIADVVVEVLETPYLRYRNGQFYMHDSEAIAAEKARLEAERIAKAAQPRSWLHRLCDKLFGDSE